MTAPLPIASLPTHLLDPAQLDPEDRLFRHRKVPEWGLGVWVGEEPSKRRLRFEDGQLRAFKKGFYDMLRPVDAERVDVHEVIDRILGEHAEAQELQTPDTPPVMPFERQVEVFLHLYPQGFADPAFRETWRGSEGAKRKKTHLRTAAQAAAFLHREPARARIEAGEAAALADEAIALLRSTSLLTPRQLEPLLGLDDAGRAHLGAALVQLLHGKPRFGKRFKAWLGVLRELGLSPGWRLATAWLGLAKPNRHMPIRRQVVQLQARCTSPVKLPSSPSLAGYRRARRVAHATRDRLVEQGLSPDDLLDVYAFVWETLRPKGQKLGQELSA